MHYHSILLIINYFKESHSILLIINYFKESHGLRYVNISKFYSDLGKLENILNDAHIISQKD